VGCGNVEPKKYEVTEGWRELYEEKLHEYTPYRIVLDGEIKGNKVEWLCSK